MNRKPVVALLGVIFTVLVGTGSVRASGGQGSETRIYRLETDTVGRVEKHGNLWNLSVSSVDANVFKAEYEAGFLQGKLQAPQMLSARDNNWDAAFLTDQSPELVKKIPPSKEEIAAVQATLLENYDYLIGYIEAQHDPLLARNLRRLLYRMIGVYHGASREQPAVLTFSGDWLPGKDFFAADDNDTGLRNPRPDLYGRLFPQCLLGRRGRTG